jgi:hypothetical protein
MKILVVDDDENSRIFLERALRSQGHDVQSASNGKSALEHAQASPPEMIISDILMPEMNGFELCHRVKTDPRLQTIPFIFYTATFVGQQDEQLALSLGASRFLVKPMEPEAFFQAIDEVISVYHAQHLPVPESPLADESVLEHMQSEALARKLDKKVRELHAAVARAEASEEQLRLALEAGRMGVWVWEYPSDAMTWSTGFARIIGRRIEDFDGRFTTFLTLVHPDDRQELLRQMEVARTSHQFFTHEFRICWPDGSVHWVAGHGTFEYEQEGTLLRMRGVLMDITERKRAEDALRESEERYRVLTESSTVGIWQIDLKGNTRYVNPTMCTMLEIADIHEIAQKSQVDFYTPDTADHVRQEYAKRAPGVILRYEAVLIGMRGTRRDVLVTDAPIVSSQGVIDSFISTFTDITALKESARAKDQFLMILSHELKTPLTSILGWTQAAKKMPDAVAQALETIERNALDQKGILEDLLDVSQIVTGRLAISVQPIEVWPLVQESIEGMMPFANERHITLQAHPPDVPLPLDGDPGRLKQVVRNLLDNALKYTASGGTVTVSAYRQDNWAVIAVQDTGRGIAPDDLPKLFTPFQQLARSEEIGGLGLGLILVRGIVLAHHGRVTVDSPGVGKGSTFRVWLPLRDEASGDQ